MLSVAFHSSAVSAWPMAASSKPSPVRPAFGASSSLPPKPQRLQMIFYRLAALPPANHALEAYRQISETMNAVEDEVLGVDTWNPPRAFKPENPTQRMYPVFPHSFFPVDGWPGVMLLKSRIHNLFISRTGAMQVQVRDPDDPGGKTLAYAKRPAIFEKPDAWGRRVWHRNNRR